MSHSYYFKELLDPYFLSTRELEWPQFTRQRDDNIPFEKYLNEYIVDRCLRTVDEVRITVAQYKRESRNWLEYLDGTREYLQLVIDHIRANSEFRKYPFIEGNLAAVLIFVETNWKSPDTTHNGKRELKPSSIHRNKEKVKLQGNYDISVTELFDELIRLGFIEDQGSTKKQFQKLFNGEEVKVKINWITELQDLHFFIDCLKSSESIEFSRQHGIWLLFERSFLLDGKPISKSQLSGAHKPNVSIQAALLKAVNLLG